MKFLTRSLLFLFFFLTGNFLIEKSYAQSIPTSQNSDLLSIVMIPSVPAPDDHVSVNLKSYLTDLNRAVITWTVNGKTIKKGRGETSFEFTVGKVGELTRITITIVEQNGETLVKNISVRPGSVDLLYEAETYVPPFYDGKALYTAESDLKIFAMPLMTDLGGVKLNPKNVVFRWTVNGTFLESASGFGKDILRLTGSKTLRTTEIEVEASSLDGSVKAKGRLNLDEASPQTILYENNPLLGIFYEKALPSSFTLLNREVVLSAVPYFFSISRKNDLDYSWSQNDTILPDEKRSEVTFRREGEKEGSSFIEIEVKNPLKMFQFGDAAYNIFFGESSRSNISF